MRIKLPLALAFAAAGVIAIALGLILTRELRHRLERSDAAQRASLQLGSRANTLAQTTFWLVQPSPENLALIRAGQVPTFAEGATGLATPVHPDGYFVTAAHCVQPGIKLLTLVDTRLELREISIVFQGDGRTPVDDACILHVDGLVPKTVTLASLPPSNDGPIFAVVRAGRERLVLAGRITRRGHAPPGVRAIAIETDFPFVGGESGGPIFDANGSFIGVTSARRSGDWFGLRSAGFVACPQPSFIADVIRRDRSSRAGTAR